MKASHILGLNARTQLYSYKPETYAVFKEPRDVLNFNWNSLPNSFALKPNKGLGGEGIIVVKKRSKEEGVWITTHRKKVEIDDLKLHVLDILEGAFSIRNVPDVAYVEEFIGRHKAFRRYAFRGTPDIRVIVFNKVPIMAMLRLPTKESGGRANLHQGAIAVGIDIATGITTKAYWKKRYIKYKPSTKRKLHGIKIPKWTSILEMAVTCSEVSKLGYVGADIVLHPEKGPMVLELNYQPGLQIQLSNVAGLKKRLERVEDLEVKDAEHGVKIAKALFASSFADRVRAEGGVKTVKSVETIKIYAPGKKRAKVEARIDTGAVRSSIDRSLAKDLGLLNEDNILWKNKFLYRSATGRQTRPVIALTFRLAGRKIKTTASVADRSKMSTPVLIGRRDLEGYLVNPEEQEK